MTHIKREARIPAQWADRRLDQAAAGLWPEFSRSRIKQWIQMRSLLLDGCPVVPRTRVALGQVISLDARLLESGPALPEAIALSVVVEDEALRQIDAWGVEEIAATLQPMIAEIAERAQALGFTPTPAGLRAPHMVGLRRADASDDLAARLARERVYVSVRDNAIRVAPHLYNEPRDIDALFAALGRL